MAILTSYLRGGIRSPFKNRIPRFVLLWIVVLLACGVTAFAAPEKAAWTLMIYQDADNSLETPAIANLNEILQTDFGPDVRVIVLCDRSVKGEPKDQYTNEDVGGLKNWSGAKLLSAAKGKLTEIEDWGATNMAAPATLKRFVNAAAKAAPAAHYGLILSDHGNGWSALCVDESHQEAALTLRDLRGALEEFAAAQGKLDLVGIDACLMGNFETAQALAPVAHILVASEEVEPAHGWNYPALLTALRKNPALSGAELGRIAAESYYRYYAAATDARVQRTAAAITMSALSLDRLDPLQKALAALGDRCSDALRGKQRQGWLRLARARADAEEYGSMTGRGKGGEEMHDLLHLAQLLQTSEDAALSAAAKTVAEATQTVVLYAAHGPARPHANGLSIYFPVEGVRLDDPQTGSYLRKTFAMESRWIHFLALYAVGADDFTQEPRLKPVQASDSIVTPSKPITLSAQVLDDDIETVHFVILAHDGPDVLLIGRLPSWVVGKGQLGQRWQGLWFMLSNKKKVVTCPITSFEAIDDKNMEYLASVSAQLRRKGAAQWRNVAFVFHVKIKAGAPTGDLVYAIADTVEGPLEIKMQKGDEIRPVYIALSPDGEAKTSVADKERGFLAIDDPEDFSLAWAGVGPGAYQVGFEVINLAGKGNLSVAEVQVK